MSRVSGFRFQVLAVLLSACIATPVLANDLPGTMPGTMTVPAPSNVNITADLRNMFDVSFETAQEAVSQQLTEKGVGDKVSAIISGHTNKPIFSYNRPTTVEARGLQFDKQSGHWQASLVFLSDGNVVSAIPVSGHFDELIEAAVVKREIRSGDIIHEGDIEIRDFGTNQVRGDTITDLSGLIGKSAIRTISPFRPIRTMEVMTPALIKKDALVQMRFTSPGMSITAAGQAITAGAKGEVISVRNVTSKKIVQAVVEDSQTVNAIDIGAQHAQN